MLDPSKPIYLLHKLTLQDCRNNHVIGIFENQFKIEILKIGNLKLKFEN